jgi:predicted O-methyltransferase YrrM
VVAIRMRLLRCSKRYSAALGVRVDNLTTRTAREVSMDHAVTQVLERYALRAEKERREVEAAGGQFNADELLLWVGPDSGSLLNMLAKGGRATHILELGTSYGYSTVWLAEAAKANGGKVTSCELSKDKQAYAHESSTAAGLAEHVELRTGDALEIIPTLAGGIDFVLVDLWKDMYVRCLELFFPKLAPGAVIVADNMLRPTQARHDALAYRRAVRAKPGISSVMLPIGSGLEISRLTGPQDEGVYGASS